MHSRKGNEILTRYLEFYNQFAGANQDEESSSSSDISDDTKKAVEKTLFKPNPPPCPVTLESVPNMRVSRRPKGARYKKYYSENNLNESKEVPSICSDQDDE